MIKATIPMSVLQTDTQIQPLALYSIMAGVHPERNRENVTYNIENEFFTLDYAKLVVSKGGEVQNFPLFIEIDAESDEVDSGLIGSTITDEEEVVTSNTWSTWMLPNHSVLERAGRLFVGTNAHTGSDLPFSELLSISDKLILPSDLPEEEEVVESE